MPSSNVRWKNLNIGVKPDGSLNKGELQYHGRSARKINLVVRRTK
jgi:hypothetical protein